LARRINVPVIQWLHNYRPISPGGALQAGNQRLEPEDPKIYWKESIAGSWRGRFSTFWLSLGYSRLKGRGSFHSVRAWIAVSESMREVFLKAGLNPELTHALHHSWDIAPAIESAPVEKPTFLYLGRLIPEKGVEFLVQLFSRPALSDFNLVIAGDGPLRARLESIGPKNIQWAGFITGSQKQQLFGAATALLFPSLWPEPLSTAAYEAFQNRRPVLTSEAGGMKEIISDRATGRVLPTGDFVAWQNAILEVAHHRATALEWGNAGRQWLETHVSPQAFNARFSQILAKTGIRSVH